MKNNNEQENGDEQSNIRAEQNYGPFFLNRDISAVLNLRYFALHQLKHGSRQDVFRRQGQE